LTVDQRTQAFLHTADENRAVAQRLLSHSDLQPAARRWAIAAAFYAAVHLVNAYIWGRLRIEPANHGERQSFVETESVLRTIGIDYRQLQRRGFDARYVPRFVPSEALAITLVTRDLEQIRTVVMMAFADIDGISNDD